MNVQEARLRNAVADKTSEQFILDSSSFPQRIAVVAAVAAAEADAVDRDARFPQKAIDAARAQRLLGIRSRWRSAATAHRSPTSPTCATRSAAPARPRR